MAEVKMRSEDMIITDEIQQLVNGYDFHTMYIESYDLMCRRDAENNVIIRKLKKLGVSEIKSREGKFFEI